MVSTLFTAFAMIATGQVGPASLDPSAARARSEWLAELEAETSSATTSLFEAEKRDRQHR